MMEKTKVMKKSRKRKKSYRERERERERDRQTETERGDFLAEAKESSIKSKILVS